MSHFSAHTASGRRSKIAAHKDTKARTPMQSPQQAQIYRAWDAFHRQADPKTYRDTVPSIIYESWYRSVAGSVPQAALAEPTVTPVTHNMLSAGVPHLEDLHQTLWQNPSAILLTDALGTVLAIECNLLSVPFELKAELQVGGCWAEWHLGTNAIALALHTAMPVQVVGAEHFYEELHGYSDSAAPVHDPDGNIVGAVGFITLLERTNPAQLGMVMTTAHTITAQLQTNLLLAQANQRLRQLNHILETATEGIITWDTQGRVDHINQRACQILDVSTAALLGQPIGQIVEFGEHVQAAIDRQRELTDVETSVQVGDRLVRCLMSVRVIRNAAGETLGGTAMLRTASQVHSWLNQQTSAPPTMTFDDFQFRSRQMANLIRQAKAAARGSLPVLIEGEDGVGKTTLAQAIHNAGPRRNKPLVVVNCGVVPNDFMVEELLGQEARAGEAGRLSKFELADGGTLLLDRIERLSLEAQQMLLSVMNSRGVTRLHARRTLQVNVRILATTNEDIETLTQLGGFLPSLYALLKVFHLQIAPLRERREDILGLAERFSRRVRGPDVSFGPQARAVLSLYPWPGNVRELENVLTRVASRSDEETICVDDLPENVRTQHSLRPDAKLPERVMSLQQAELEAILRAGWAHRGAVGAMAETLGINRSTLWRKFKQYDLSADDFKS